MLALTRKKGESLVVNNNIEITVLEIRGDQIKIGIQAPKDVPIYRKEVYLQIQESNKDAFESENVDALKRNGKLFFLDRDLKKLKYTSSRPLSSSHDALKNLYKTRYPIYKDVCDVRIDANCKINDVVNKILGGK